MSITFRCALVGASTAAPSRTTRAAAAPVRRPPAGRPAGRRRLALMAAAAMAACPWSASAVVEQASIPGTANNRFGFGVSEVGSAGLIGAPGSNAQAKAAQGAAYVFRSLDTAAGTVTQTAMLVASDEVNATDLGWSVAFNGSTGIVGAIDANVGANSAQGAAYVFRNLDTATGTVTQNAKLVASDGASGDTFGVSAALSGPLGLVGAEGASVNGHGSQGAAYEYRGLDSATGTTTQSAKLVAGDGAANDYFGAAVSQSGSTGLVGAYGAAVGGKAGQGAAYVFQGLDAATGTVTQNAKLVASDGAAGDIFGFAVVVNGTDGLIGAEGATGGGQYSGAAYLFHHLDTAAGTVTQAAKLVVSNGTVGALGESVSLSGGTALVGANNAAALYLNLSAATGTVTQDVVLTASVYGGSNFGYAVSLDGDQFNVGGYGTNSTSSVGRAYYGTVSSVTTLDAGNASRLIGGISFVSQDDWVVGQTTSGNQVTLGTGDAATVTAAGRAVYVGRTAGSNNNRLLVQGTVTATTVVVGAATGATGNVLEIGSDATLTTAGKVTATGGITVNPGGTLLFSGSANSVDRIGDATPLILAGGTFNLGGLSERFANLSAAGTLAVTATSTLDFGPTGTSNTIQFAGVGSHTAGQALRIVDWEGTPNVANGPDELLFTGSAAAFTLAYPQADVSFDGVPGYAVQQDGSYFEVYAAPEPGSLPLLSAAAAAVLGRRRRRL